MEEKKKCWNCGEDYEGNFCPHCGAQNIEEKKCPKCGLVVKGNAHFCTGCGYTFKAREKQGKFIKKVANFFKNVWSFILGHKKLAISGLAGVVATVTLATVLSYASNIFRASKVDNIELGYTKEQVEEVLGEFHKQVDGSWYYYDDEYLKLYNEFNELVEKLFDVKSETQIAKITKRMEEIEKQVFDLEYKVIEVVFSADETVKKISYNAKMLESAQNTVKWTGTKWGEKIVVDDVYVGDSTSSIPVKIYYADGSYQNYVANTYKATDKNGNDDETGKCTLSFSDDWGEYTTTITMKDLVERVENGIVYKGTKENPYRNLVGVLEENRNIESFIIPETTVIIEEYAFEGCENLKEIVIPNSVTKIKAFAFCKSSITTIRFNGTKAQWDAYKQINYWSITSIVCTDGTITIS